MYQDETYHILMLIICYYLEVGATGDLSFSSPAGSLRINESFQSTGSSASTIPGDSISETITALEKMSALEEANGILNPNEVNTKSTVKLSTKNNKKQLI